MSDLVKTNVSMFLEVVKKHIRMFCAKRNNSICPKRGSYQLRVLFNYHMNDVSLTDLEIFRSGGPLTALRGGPLQSRFSDSLYKQPIFFPKRGPGPPGPPSISTSVFINQKITLGHLPILYR